MPVTDCLHTIFARRAAEQPHRIAVTCGDHRLSYSELDRLSGELAERLRGYGVRPGVHVGVCVDRSVDLVVSVLAVVKAGGAYVPVDAEHPAARVAAVLAGSRVPVTVAVTRTADSLAEWSGPVLWADDSEDDDAADDGDTDGEDPQGEVTAAGVTAAGVTAADGTAERTGGTDAVREPAAEAGPDDPAYVIHTSGSTGAPKGVEVTHRSVVALLEHGIGRFGFGSDDTWTLFHSIGFDFSVWELWGALLSGGRLVVVPGRVARTPALMLDLVRREQVTVLNQTPSAFRQLAAAYLADEGPDELRLVVFGGERLDVGVLAPWIARRGDDRPELVNMYGITEVTVHATARRIVAADLDRPSVSPIGRPLPGVRIELRDETGAAVPDGTPGELYVAGAGLARGYLHQPELTAERFVTSGGERWYRSGDRAVRTDGDLVYLGRVDRQLKVRGYRIEPGEVEAAVLAHPGVGTALVTAQDFGEGDVRLVAYVTPPPGADPDTLTEADLAATVADLPGYLRPSRFHVVADIPLTVQGKADVAVLDRLTEPAGDDAVSGVKAIADEVLRRDVPVDGDLFDLGATSLALTRIVAMVNDRFGIALTGAEMEEPTVGCLAEVVDASRRHHSLQQVGG
ncbi:non-ribosomal peptide synthetase [Micromonospora sp. C28ISP2-4]|uniref:non-ribosomal peptide synthetase n=1 Tax=Micromonospora sp. C28ISP2-4 TaxID=3059523 RepID=UPI002675DF53|nr:non-ribosomal peptide synthetase [Micromonospora sp. C28ISP2-4]MDO3686600.1 non-ribosomal peptide synthetase [Micromonospora sp. C28ISP2-4]